MSTESAPARVAGMTTFDALVVDAIRETPDSTTLVLDTGAPAKYRAGQYLTIDPHQFIGLRNHVAYLEHLKGRKEAPRAYSMCSAPHEQYVAVTIKEEVFGPDTKYPPLISGFLTYEVRAGDRMIVAGYTGAYALPDNIEARGDHILHLCAGSGSVPNFSMIKDSLHRHARLRHTFVYSNKTWQDVIFRDELTRLQKAHRSRLRVIHALTRDQGPFPSDVDVRTGRVNAELLQDALGDQESTIIYACGPAITVWERRACAAEGRTPPPRFLESMVSQLTTLGVPREKIKLEAYG
jgi:3-ketosteroid 9alpha-monooxygenase subunit B